MAIAFLVVTSGAFAQFNKGRYLVGGSIGFSGLTSKSDNNGTTTTLGKSTSFSLAPSAGYFFMNNVAAGATLNLSTSSYKPDGNGTKVSSNGFTLTPFVRYYLQPGIFFQGLVGFGSSKSKATTGATTTETKYSSFDWALGVGYAYFLNDFVSIEPLLQYGSSSDKLKSTDAKNISSGINFRVGIQVYLGSRD